MSEQTPKDRFGNPLALDDTVIVLRSEVANLDDPDDFCNVCGQVAIVTNFAHVSTGVECLVENDQVVAWVSTRDLFKPQMPLNHARRNENPHPSSHA